MFYIFPDRVVISKEGSLLNDLIKQKNSQMQYLLMQ